MKRQDFNKNWVLQKEDGSKIKVSLPHDAMIAEQRSPDSPGESANAYFPGGFYIYEKDFFVPKYWQDEHIVFQFEGVYKDSKVYINGTEAGGRPYGYIPFFVETAGLLNFGTENKISVVVENIKLPNSRWYTGSGIYRPVWLWVGSEKHINIEGVKISTLSYSPARIKVETSHTGGNVAVAIQRDGEIVAEGKGDTLTLDIPNTQLWSDETPELYQCHVTLTENGVIVDETTETFGVRLVEWSPKGLFVNGKETLLRGGCVHHDNGILGACSYAESEERRVRILKKAGFNAIRSSHNPASPAMLKACDQYGMYVMDETWDMWYGHKNKYDYASDFMDNYKTDIKAMVDQDFNHPSVIMYSIGNEISEPHEQKGIFLAKAMTEYIHSIDINRAVTCGVNLWLILMASKGKGIYKEEDGLSTEKPQSKRPAKKDKQKAVSSTLFNMITSKVGTHMNKAANSKRADKITSPCLDALDIAGYNYASGRYPLEGKAHPNRVVVGSETFPQDIAKNWDMVKKYPYLIGDFMWAAWDYLGEAGAGAWAYTNDGTTFKKPYPWLLADAGAIDILGNIGAEAEYAARVWGLRDKPYIGVRPVNHPGVKPYKMVWRGTNAIASWAWQGCEGNEAIVEVYARADHVELWLNNKQLSKKKIKNYKAIFKTRYIPGTLTAIAYDKNGKELSRSDLISAEGSRHINIIPEKNSVNAGEIVYVDINITGENGIIESNADTKLDLMVEGGKLLAFGSANPRTKESYLSGSFTTYYGRAQAVVRADEAGVIRITTNGGNMKSVFVEIEAIKKQGEILNESH
ncbi:beta-galactosidase [Spirochaetia bacterium]|nr:beta-galactosidase [Spirochaetia bacterium]